MSRHPYALFEDSEQEQSLQSLEIEQATRVWRPEKDKKAYGVVYMLLSALSTSLIPLLVKLIDHISAVQVLFIRSISTTLLAWMIVRYTGKRNQMKEAFGAKLLIIGGLGFLSSYCYFVSLRALSVLEVIIIMLTAAPIDGVIAKIANRERSTMIEYAVGSSCCLALFFTARPTVLFGEAAQQAYSQDEYTVRFSHASSAMMCLLSVILMILVKNILQGTGKEWSPFVPSFNINATTVGVIGLWLSFSGGWQTMDVIEVLLAITTGLLSLTASSLTIKAVQAISPKLIIEIKHAELLIALSLDMLILGNLPNWFTVISGLLILGNLLAITALQ